MILRAPHGFGKTRLVDEFIAKSEATGLPFIRVNPEIRPDRGGTLYSGFFAQQCAAALDQAAQAGIHGIDTIEAFLKARRWKSVRSRKFGETLQKFPSFENLYGVAFESIERLFVFGRYGREHLLTSDSREAIAACQAYVDDAVGRTPMVLAIRQAEHFDHQSLRLLFELNKAADRNLIIMEYSADDNRFAPDHWKVFERELRARPEAQVFQLLELEPQHLAVLLRQLQIPDQLIEWTSQGGWNGSLNELLEYRRFVTVHTHGLSQPTLLEGPPDVRIMLAAEVEALSAPERMLIAIVIANGADLEKRLLLDLSHAILSHETNNRLERLLDGLVARRLLASHENEIGLSNAELAALGGAAPGLGAALALAERHLRDFYIDAFRSGAVPSLARSAALRRALALTATTGDPQLLLELVQSVDSEITKSNDQGIYVDVIFDVVGGDTALLPSERRQLTNWAANLSYDICDFRRCRALLEPIERQSPLEAILLANCLIEFGEHDAALAIAQRLRDPRAPDLERMADLLDAMVALDGGDWPRSRALLSRIINDENAAPALRAHALRLMPEMLDYPVATETAVASVYAFEELGLLRSSAYSALSASRFLAREGRIGDARKMLRKTKMLRDAVRDEHIIRNDNVLVDLLSLTPDYPACIAQLELALRTSRDDFSDLVLLCNLAIARIGSGACDAAVDCVMQGATILDAPGFADRDILWSVCFNFAKVLDAVGRTEEAKAMRARPYASDWTVRSEDQYWGWRYGEFDAPDPEHQFVARFAYHPVALSHWQVEREALATLTAEWPR